MFKKERREQHYFCTNVVSPCRQNGDGRRGTRGWRSTPSCASSRNSCASPPVDRAFLFQLATVSDEAERSGAMLSTRAYTYWAGGMHIFSERGYKKTKQKGMTRNRNRRKNIMSNTGKHTMFHTLCTDRLRGFNSVKVLVDNTQTSAFVGRITGTRLCFRRHLFCVKAHLEYLHVLIFLSYSYYRQGMQQNLEGTCLVPATAA